MIRNKQWEELYDRVKNPEKYKLIERNNKINKILDIKEVKENKFKKYLKNIFKNAL